ncbi:MAG: sodium:proton antiporter [Actinobacteria bacterium]|nr:sodium:proton antiporter [Actinomycetota bacterium]
MTARDVIETLAIILAAGLLAEAIAGALRLPRMIVLLAAGVALGPEALDFLDLPLDSIGVELLLLLGVSFILFHGGLGLSFDVLSRVGIGLVLLAIPGVLITAVVVGLAATAVFGVPFEAGFLIGAVLAPTDPAILIPLFERLRVREKVRQTVIAESGLNDAVGAVLALSVATFVLESEGSFAEPLTDFATEVVVSVAIGAGFGLLLAVVLSDHRFGLWRESSAVALMGVVAATYASTDFAGGSGYMGAVIAGLIAGNAESLRLGRAEQHERELHFVAERITDVVVLFVFIAVGANLPLGEMADEALAALAVIAVLILVARPLTVVACLLPDRRGRWEWREIGFVAWTRETGVVPVALAGILFAEGVPYENEIVTSVAFAVIVTLLLQSTTKQWLARRFGLLEEVERPV